MYATPVTTQKEQITKETTQNVTTTQDNIILKTPKIEYIIPQKVENNIPPSPAVQETKIFNNDKVNVTTTQDNIIITTPKIEIENIPSTVPENIKINEPAISSPPSLSSSPSPPIVPPTEEVVLSTTETKEREIEKIENIEKITPPTPRRVSQEQQLHINSRERKVPKSQISFLYLLFLKCYFI